MRAAPVRFRAARKGPLLIAALVGPAGCIRESTNPFLGDCAEPPPGVHTFGEVGIGTCLAGPVDLRFAELGGTSWLAVTNADPYLNFTGGSLLLIDWSSVDLGRRDILVDELAAHAVDLPRYVGEVAVLEDRAEALVTSRLSEGAVTRATEDDAIVVDLGDPTRPAISRAQPTLKMRDDPFPIQVDPSAGRLYVGNLTDHSVSVVDSTTPRLELVDVAPATRIEVGGLIDLDGSGSSAQIAGVSLEAEAAVIDDRWTLEWIEGQARVWVPTPVEEPDLPNTRGLVRWSSGDLAHWTPSALGVEVGGDTELGACDGEPLPPPPFTEDCANGVDDDGDGSVDDCEVCDNTEDGEPVDDDLDGAANCADDACAYAACCPRGVEDPMLVVSDGVPLIYHADGGRIRSQVNTGLAGGWEPFDDRVLEGRADGWDAYLGGPSLTSVDGRVALYFDGRTDPGAPASIGVAWSDDGVTFLADPEPVLAAGAGFTSAEDPFVLADERANRLRMWLSLRRGERWSVGLAESEDGAAWTEVEEVLALDGVDVAAPVVGYANGRYLLWYARGEAGAWSHALAWSYDGRDWRDLGVIIDSTVPFDPQAPPRVALQLEPASGWSLEGRDAGRLDVLVGSGAQFLSGVHGFGLVVASGYDAGGELFPDNRGALGVRPGSMVRVGERELLYVTITGLDQRTRLGLVERVGDRWAYLESNLIPAGEGGNVVGVEDPVVVERDGVYTLFYAAMDAKGLTTIRRATSTDGRRFAPVEGKVIQSGEDFDAAGQLPRSIEVVEDGTVRLWYAGSNGSRFRIAAAVASDPGGRFRLDPGPFDPYQLGTGLPGSFDDSGVKDPVVFTADGERRMFYSGFDGLAWHLGHAVWDGDAWVRRADELTDVSIPSMSGLGLTFSALGVDSPVLDVSPDGPRRLWYAGHDGFQRRLGSALIEGDVVYPEQRFPTPGDAMEFEITKGIPGDSVIELSQFTNEFATDGIGMSGLTLDPVRGMLFVPSKLASFVYVVDVRDDSNSTFDDANTLDLETLLRVETETTPLGFRDALVDQARDRLYLSARNPDGVVVADLDLLLDDDDKEVLYDSAVAVLPLPDVARDLGEATFALIGGDGMVLTPDDRYLLVTHFRSNSVVVFDLELGPYGEEIANIQHVGENPHRIHLSPDGRHAVVANYVGEVDDELTASSTLAVIDVDPTSESFLEVVTWIRNRLP